MINASDIAKNNIRILLDYLGEKSILIIDPSVNYRMSLKQFLVNLKIKNPCIVSNVSEAKTAMLQASFGMIVCEWNLPEYNGLQFCRELRGDPAYQEVGFLLTSVENMRRDVILASEVGVDSYLLKPFSFEDFRDQLLSICKVQRRTDSFSTYLIEADRAFEQKNFALARDFYEKAQSKRPNSARAATGLALVMEQEGNREEAILALSKALKLNPLYMDGHKAHLSMYEAQNNIHGIIHVALKLHELSPDNPRYTLMLAKNYLEIAELDMAEKYFRSSIKLSPMLAEAYKGLGSVFMLREEYDEAMGQFHKALDIDAHDVTTLNSLALLYIRMGKIEEGIAKYNLILKIEPNDPRVHFNLGFAYERMGKPDLAEKYYNEALIRDPSFIKAKRGLQRLAS